MSVIWGHTPKYYPTADAPKFWDICHDDVTVDSNDGYNGEPALSGSSLDAYVVRYLRNASGNEPVLGCRIKFASIPSSEKILLGFTDAGGALLACLTILDDGRIAVYRGDREQLLGISEDVLTTGQHYRLGMEARIASGTAGRVRAVNDDASLVDADGVDVGSGSWGGIYIGPGTDIFISDIYAADDGDMRPGTLIRAVVSSNAALDDTDPDDDTTVVELDAPGSPPVYDSFSDPLASFTTPRLIYGVTVQALVKAVTTPAGYRPLASDDGHLTYGERQSVFTDDYHAIDEHYATNPRTGEPWTDADLPLVAFGGEART